MRKKERNKEKNTEFSPHRRLLLSSSHQLKISQVPGFESKSFKVFQEKTLSKKFGGQKKKLFMHLHHLPPPLPLPLLK